MGSKIQQLPFILIPLVRGKYIGILPDFCKKFRFKGKFNRQSFGHFLKNNKLVKYSFT